MKRQNILTSVSPFLLIILSSIFLNAQKGEDTLIPSMELNTMVDSIAKLVESKYIDATMGKKMSNHIKVNHQKGNYKNMTYKALGQQLRKDFLEVSDDVHMSAFYRKQTETPKATILETHQDDYGAKSNFGYIEVKILEEFIGYLKIAHFTKWKFFEEAKTAATNSIQMLQHTNALIIDVRDNPGGFEDIVAYLMSYFFEGESFHLQKYFCRYENKERSIQTSSNIPGIRLPEIPIYILVNEGTGSAAESLAYMMKHLNRATIIGETTVGAGNGSTYFRVSDKFLVQIATWETINAITKTSWEKTGVTPNIKTTSDEAFDKALGLAKVAGRKYRSNILKQQKTLLDNLDRAFESHPNQMADDSLVFYLTESHKQGFHKEHDINNLGYRLLGQPKKSKTAELVFKVNTILYPNSANVYDSYAEALALNGKSKKALIAYEKAVSLAKKNGSESLTIFIDNLERHKKKMK